MSDVKYIPLSKNRPTIEEEFCRACFTKEENKKLKDILQKLK